MNEIKQFKLVSGEEIVCEVVEWPSDDFSGMVIRRVLMIKTSFDEKGNRYYTFRPWMALQEGTEKFISLEGTHVMGEANPDLVMLKNYKEAVENNELSEEELLEKVEKYVEKMKEIYNEDSDQLMDDNILAFPSKNDRIH
jgi:hypothetical protein|tara:strand:+ start:142 stop:561 length:420 start_codon:yes stop_codon:yes gene_type:complete